MNKNSKIIEGLEFLRTCESHPEQHEVFVTADYNGQEGYCGYCDKKQVGYVRYRFGRLTVQYPDHHHLKHLFCKDLGGDYDGWLEDEERKRYLPLIAKLIKREMRRQKDKIG